MEAYTDFAYIYDNFMEEVPYEKWADFLSSLISSYGDGRPPRELSVTDLACGTGRLTLLMAKRGYRLTGTDFSADMLAVAQDKALTEKAEVLFINQDMRELALLDSSDVIYSSFDSVNYLLTDEDMVLAFTRVAENLTRGGLFLFDFNTLYKYEQIGEKTIAEDRPEGAFIWENYFDPETHINEYDMTFFIKEDRKGEELFRRTYETHLQRGYTLAEMKQFLEKANLRFVAALDSESAFGKKREPSEESERIHIIARK